MIKPLATLTLSVLAASCWFVLDDHDDARAAHAATATPTRPALVAPAAATHALVTALDADARPLVHAVSDFAASPEDKAAKKIAKLEKKLAKTQKKLAKLEDKADALDLAADALEAELAAAQDLPDEDPKDAKKKAKLIKKLQKKLASLAKKGDKLEGKQVKTTDQIGTVADALEDLDPGHSAGDVPGMLVAEQMSVVTPDAGLISSAFASVYPPESDYETDEVSTHVWDRAMEPVDSVNALLCYIGSTGYADMVNRGHYIAQVDESRCESGGDTGSNGTAQGQSVASEVETPSLWTVSSSRGSEDSLQLVKLWVPDPQEDHGDGQDGEGDDEAESDGMIHAKIVVREERSDANPFGSFEMNWSRFTTEGKANPDDGYGHLATLDTDTDDDSLGFTLLEGRGDVTEALEPGENASRARVNVRMSPDLASGYAHIQVEERFGEDLGAGGAGGGEPFDTGIISHDFLIAFNETHMLRRDSEGDACFSRTSFHESVWRYGLYHASGELVGQRVDRNTGFGFETEAGDYGWASYYGIWVPGELVTGDVVTKQTFGENEAGDTLEVFVAPGRLIRNLRTAVPLADIDGMEFEWFPSTFDPEEIPQQSRLRYTHGTGEWLIVATFDEFSGTWLELAPEDIEALDSEEVEWLDMWSSALGGSVFHELGTGSLTVWSEEFVDGDDAILANGDLTLYGYHDMLSAEISEEEANTGDVYLPPAASVLAPHTQIFDAETLTLLVVQDGPLIPVGLADGVVPTGGPSDWGMRSGPLVTDTSGFASMEDIWQADEFYTYETGANPWNKFTALLEDGEFVSFDPPIEFSYQHTTAHDANGSDAADGQTFLLSYHGQGDLGGIPFDPVDLDGDEFADRWYPRFNIADGTLVGPTGTEYVIRALDKEVTLLEDPEGCEGLDLTAAAELTLPEGDVYTLPDIGKEPEIDSAPAVIDGVVQTLDEDEP